MRLRKNQSARRGNAIGGREEKEQWRVENGTPDSPIIEFAKPGPAIYFNWYSI
jgi:hypothetical protein